MSPEVCHYYRWSRGWDSLLGRGHSVESSNGQHTIQKLAILSYYKEAKVQVTYARLQAGQYNQE
jgi:hypothetical protein